MQIIPIRDLRDTNAISERCNSVHEPVFITKNGYGDMVIMSIETYERSMAEHDLYQKLAAAETDLQKGNCFDGPAVFATLKRGE